MWSDSRPLIISDAFSAIAIVGAFRFPEATKEFSDPISRIKRTWGHYWRINDSKILSSEDTTGRIYNSHWIILFSHFSRARWMICRFTCIQNPIFNFFKMWQKFSLLRFCSFNSIRLCLTNSFIALHVTSWYNFRSSKFIKSFLIEYFSSEFHSSN